MSGELHPASDTGILRARARLLARRPPEDDAHAGSIEILEFRLGGDRYAIETRHVRGVHPLRNMTPLPCTPAFVLGIVGVRGRMVPVISLKRLFELPESGLADLHRVVLVQDKDMEFGLPADAGTVVRRVPLSAIQPAPPLLGAPAARCIGGITADGVALLDMEAVFADPRILVDEEPDKSG